MGRRSWLILGVLLLAWPAYAQQQKSYCADCHFANGGGPAPRHLSDWDLSAHGRTSVGCESCHGGDPSTTESFLAHRTIVKTRGLENPVNRRNLPATCGKCHTGQFVEFQKSKHYLILRNGDTNAPSCSTCHGDVGADLPSPRALESECRQCHGEGKVAPKPEYPAQAKLLLEQVRGVRENLKDASSLIKRIKDAQLKKSFEDEWQQAEVPLKQAVFASHSSNFLNVEERLGVARERANTLMERLANPQARR